ncbi:uncharacterized protein LOC126372303 [Pectinophora gossypiella]|uniref:uncharacterized protein LOC126372303 n=1 Tax=Pectinophora gossypiella TaxID=13191 RepID=UPI00214F0061|nr:uncharacterized protein LOC126372303 [Pectinophora gossypiella]
METRPFKILSYKDPETLSDDCASEDSSPEEESQLIDPCVKLKLPAHIAAYYEKKELIRDAEIISCDKSLVEKVMSNYIIAKNILSNLCWQDKLLCKHVCSTWRSAVNSLVREQLSPVDFLYILVHNPTPQTNTFRKSDNFYNEPLAILTFMNTLALNTAVECKDVSPSMCETPCEDKWHCMIDVISEHVSVPKNCMLSVVSSSLTCMPVANTETDGFPVSPSIHGDCFPFYAGIYIPVLPGVQYHVLNIKQREHNTMDLQTDFYDVIDKLCEDQIFKGVLVFVTEKYILQSVEDIMLLNYLKEVQPEIPYALGGCLIEETMFGERDIETLIKNINSKFDFVSENLISIGLFTVPKNKDNNERGETCNFDMFSLVIESSEWSKQKIEKAINEFAKKVPTFEHSVALKLACVGRDRKHILEQDYFRAAFPHTPLVGCFGNGELGVNHPPRDLPPVPPHIAKKRKHEPAKSLMYSYSTVFVYMGWGRMIPPETEGFKKATQS